MGNFISEEESSEEEEFSSVVTRSTSESSENSLFVQQIQYNIIQFHHRPSSISTPQRSIASSPIPARCEESQFGGLFCQKKCLFIGSYGDKHPSDVKIARKVIIEKKTTYLPGVTADLDRLRKYCAGDVSTTLEHRHIYKDQPGQQRSKEYRTR